VDALRVSVPAHLVPGRDHDVDAALRRLEGMGQRADLVHVHEPGLADAVAQFAGEAGRGDQPGQLLAGLAAVPA